MSSTTSSLEGFQRAEAQLADSAKRLSRLPAAFTSLLSSTGAAGAEVVDIADISAESIALSQARTAADANLAAFHAFDQVQQSLLSILG